VDFFCGFALISIYTKTQLPRVLVQITLRGYGVKYKNLSILENSVFWISTSFYTSFDKNENNAGEETFILQM